MTEPLLVLGASGNARSVFAIARAMNEARPDDPPWELLGFLVDGPVDPEPIIRLGSQVVGTSADLPSFSGAHMAVGAGQVGARRILAQRGEAAGLCPATLVHPSAVVDPDVVIGEGTTVGRFVAVTTGATVGRHSMLSMHTSVAHDCVIGDFVFAAQATVLAGSVIVEDDVFLGAACAVREGTRIGAGALIGMGAVVIADVAPGAVVAGVPARVVRQAGD